MLLPTFKQCKSSRIVQVSATQSSSPEFRSLVNAACDLLMQRGDWPGTIIPIRVMVRNGCIVWPRYVQRVRRINQCRIPIKVGTIWYDFVDKEDYVGWCGANFYAWEGGGAAYRGLGQTMMQPTMSSQGRVPTFDDIPADLPRKLRIYCRTTNDAGKTITIFGADENNQPLTSTNAGIIQEGLVITLATPFVQTGVFVSRIDAIQKDYTQMSVPVYSYEPVSGTMLQLGDYAPGEINPSYAKDRLSTAMMQSACGSSCSEKPFTVIALVKLAFTPVYQDSDYVTIPSLDAIASTVQAINYKEAGDAGQYAKFLQIAVNELNHVLENEQPLDQTPVDAGFMGGVQIGMQSVV